jgi:hypothetical protein
MYIVYGAIAGIVGILVIIEIKMELAYLSIQFFVNYYFIICLFFFYSFCVLLVNLLFYVADRALFGVVKRLIVKEGPEGSGNVLSDVTSVLPVEVKGEMKRVYDRVARPIEARGVGKGDFTFMLVTIVLLQGCVMIKSMI